jgi:excisionase family DNA binding protein
VVSPQNPNDASQRDAFELMRPVDVQRLLNVSRNWVYTAAREGLLPSLRLGPQGPVRFLRADIEAFIEAARTGWRLGDTSRDTLRRAATPELTQGEGQR